MVDGRASSNHCYGRGKNNIRILFEISARKSSQRPGVVRSGKDDDVSR